MNHQFKGRGLRAGCYLTLFALLTVGCESKLEEPVVKSMVIAAPVATPAQEAPVQPVRTKEAQARMTPQEAQAELQAGNERFVAGQSRGRHLMAERRATAGHQYPMAIVVSCIDSRVPVEMVFDQGIGDVFNARVAGNVLNDDIVGSAEYACQVAGAKLIVVLGHSSCGAVKGAIDDVKLGALTGLVEKIKPAEATVSQRIQPRTSKNNLFVDAVAQENVRLVMRQIRERSAILREMIDSGKIGLTGAMYDLGTGEVRFIAK